MSNILTLNQISKMLKDRNLREVSRRTGINVQTLAGYARGKKQGSWGIASRISEYLEATTPERIREQDAE